LSVHKAPVVRSTQLSDVKTSSLDSSTPGNRDYK
jgi:hypothetical protein